MKKILSGIVFPCFLVVISVLFYACSSQNEYEFSENWFDSGRGIDENLCDVFYIVSANIISSGDSVSGKSYNALLTSEEKAVLDGEIRFVNKLFGSEFNFYSPYYHQFTLESIALPKEEFDKCFYIAETDVNRAFDYYINNLNNGRKFIIAGFSEGAMIIPSLVKKLNEEQYSRFIAAYMLGYRLSKEDLSHPNIVPATATEGTGVTISFNSVARLDAVWDFVSADAAVCTNPTTWTTDSTVGNLIFEKDTLTVAVDSVKNVLLVSGNNMENYQFHPLDSYCKPGNLHHWDILFYNNLIKENAILRAYN